MPVRIAPARRADFPQLWQLFVDVCAQQEHDEYGPSWTLDVYPTQEDLRAHVDAGELFLAWHGGKAVGTFTLTREEDPEYREAPWPSGAQHDEVSVIHLLAVHPDARGQHVGVELVRAAIELARQWKKRAIHLDVLPGNLAASRLYGKEGFELACHYPVHYDDLGDINVELYELVL